jgi:hypothetical protein
LTGRTTLVLFYLELPGPTVEVKRQIGGVKR